MNNPTLSAMALEAPARLPASASLREVAALMEDRKLSCVLVGPGISVVTEHDLAGALAAGLHPSAPVGQVSTNEAVRVTADTTLHEAVGTMGACGIRHLVVLSPGGEVQGVLSLAQATRVLLGQDAGSGAGAPLAAPRAAAGPSPHPRTIAVGFDGSTDSEAAVHWAVGLARAVGAAVVLVHAVGLLEQAASPGRADELVGRVRAIESDLGLPEGTVRLELVDGDPASALERAVSPPVGADLLVVGSRGQGAHAGLLLGSTSLALAERSRVPLVIVPAAGG